METTAAAVGAVAIAVSSHVVVTSDNETCPAAPTPAVRVDRDTGTFASLPTTTVPGEVLAIVEDDRNSYSSCSSNIGGNISSGSKLYVPLNKGNI